MLVSSLSTILAQVPDPRQASKVKHSLRALLLQVCLALLGGCRGPNAIAQWGRLHLEVVKKLGCVQSQPPSAATFSRVLRAVDWETLVAGLQSCMEAGLPEDTSQDWVGIALDGKTLRGSKKRGAEGSHILAAVLHRESLTLLASAVEDKTNEIPVAARLLRRDPVVCA